LQDFFARYGPLLEIVLKGNIHTCGYESAVAKLLRKYARKMWNGASAERRAHGRSKPSRLQVHTAKQIIELIRQDGLPIGHHLREEALAQRLDVSRTSIRAGLRILHAQRLVTARQNRGYVLARGITELQELQLATKLPTSADETLYMRIVRDRVANRLPQCATETELMRRYDCGRNLVLAALAMLSEEGLVRRGRGREWQFREVLNSPRIRWQSYELRLMLEPAALILPGFEPDIAKIEEMRDRQVALMSSAGSAMSWRDVFDVDASFHELLAEFSGNEFLLEVIRQHNRLRRLIEYESYPNSKRVRAWSREHVAVIDAILEGNNRLASRRLAQHLRNAMGPSGKLAPAPDKATSARIVAASTGAVRK
jgi:DNA-binding GntR family transcriptional regulator